MSHVAAGQRTKEEGLPVRQTNDGNCGQQHQPSESGEGDQDLSPGDALAERPKSDDPAHVCLVHAARSQRRHWRHLVERAQEGLRVVGSGDGREICPHFPEGPISTAPAVRCGQQECLKHDLDEETAQWIPPARMSEFMDQHGVLLIE